MRKLERCTQLARSYVAEKCKDESALLVARRWMCRFYDPRVKFQHQERETELLYEQSVCVCEFVRNGKKNFNILKRFPLLLNSDSSRIKFAASKTPGRLSEPRQVQSQTAPSQSAPSSPLLRTSVSMFRVRAFKVEVWNSFTWLMSLLSLVYLLLCRPDPLSSSEFSFECFSTRCRHCTQTNILIMHYKPQEAL